MSATTYVGLVRDHSASMDGLQKGAAADYNLTIAGIRQSVLDEGHPAIISVVECGVGPMGRYRLVEEGVPAGKIQNITSYSTSGSATPLWDSVGAAIQACRDAAKRNGDLDREDTAFLIMVITDGEENRSTQWTAASLSAEIRRLQATDRWTFAFRVPRGSKRVLTGLGIPEGNVIEWEQSEKALSQSTQATVSGVQSYFKGRASGARSSSSFYADVSSLTKTEVKEALTEIKYGIQTAKVRPSEDGMAIRDFCVSRFNDYTPGGALYELTKSEKVQGHKRIAIREASTGKFYTGPAARQLLGLPDSGDIRLVPSHNGGKFDIFVQSTSFNRKLVGGTTVVYLKV